MIPVQQQEQFVVLVINNNFMKKCFTPLNFLTKNLRGFTFIEILVVVTIIGLLTVAGAVSYSQFVKQSRDAKRKVDIEQIRAAIEIYRSNNSLYPLTAAFDFSNCSNPGTISDASSTYLSKTPNDPKCSTMKYYYSSSDGSTYSIAVRLEGSSVGSCIAADACGVGYYCNYCLGSYGQTN